MDRKIISLLILGIFMFFAVLSCSIENIDSDSTVPIINEINEAKCQQNSSSLGTINKIFKYIRNGKSKQILKYLADDVEWTVAGEPGIVPFAGTYNGKMEVKEYFDSLFTAIIIKKLEIRYHLQQENNINSHILLKGLVKATGKKFDIEFVYSWTMNDQNKIVNQFTYCCTYSLANAFAEGGDMYVTDFRSNDDTFTKKPTAVLETVQQVYGAFSIGDIEGLKTYFTEDVVWILKGDNVAVPYAGEFIGKDGIQTFFDNLFSSISYDIFYIWKVVVDGNRVDFHGYEECVALNTGEPYTCHYIHSFVINDDGLLTEFVSTNDSYNVSEAYTPD